MKGKIIVFEGIDGSGKNTQANLFYRRLKERFIPCEFIEFPCYSETFFGKEIANYLNGKFGNLYDIDPKLSAILFAGDRYEKKRFLLEHLQNRAIIICDRYVSSNIAYQCAKLEDNRSRSKLRDWIEHLEYKVFSLPSPDLVVFMDISPDFVKPLIAKRKTREYTKKKQDLHEANRLYQNKAYDIFVKMSQEEKWVTVKCIDRFSIREISDISDEIFKILDPYLLRGSD